MSKSPDIRELQKAQATDSLLISAVLEMIVELAGMVETAGDPARAGRLVDLMTYANDLQHLRRKHYKEVPGE